MPHTTHAHHPHLVAYYVVLAFLILFFFCPAPRIEGATYFVRTDGGSAEQCSGTTNAPWPGSGTNQACAWDHPFRALPPGGTPRILGADTLIIASGSYMMGFGAPGAEACEAAGSWDCVMPPVPSGMFLETPTRILGNCSNPPELWGTERANTVLNLDGSSNVEIACLEITDHSGCVESHSGAIACNRDTSPFGSWAVRGIYAADSSNVTLRHVDIHGLASTGVHAGRLRDWSLTDVRIAANGWVGWDGDIEGDDTNDGIMSFNGWHVEWNGCGETWPEEEPNGCWAQSAGGYGDGVGTGATRGRWVIEDSSFLFNTSDGLDLLYVVPGGSIELRRVIATGNAGNQVKTAGPATIENSVIVGNCGWFDGNPVTHDVDNCRAGGNALAVFLHRGARATVINNTIASEGDCVVIAGCRDDAGCDGTETVTLRNNIHLGTTEFLDTTDLSCMMYWEGIADSVIDSDYAIVHGAKHDGCPGAHDLCDVDPMVVNPAIDAFDGRLRIHSPAIGSALKDVAPSDDVTRRPRDLAPDRGAYEYRLIPTRPRPARKGP